MPKGYTPSRKVLVQTFTTIREFGRKKNKLSLITTLLYQTTVGSQENVHYLPVVHVYSTVKCISHYVLYTCIKLSPPPPYMKLHMYVKCICHVPRRYVCMYVMYVCNVCCMYMSCMHMHMYVCMYVV